MITAITVEEYETQYWPKLEASIDQLLTMKPGEYLPIYYEQMYRCGGGVGRGGQMGTAAGENC